MTRHDPPSTPRGSWRTRLLRPFVVMPAIALVVVAVWWFALRNDAVAQTATTVSNSTTQLASVTTGSMSTTVSAEGTVAAAETDDLSFASSGTVTAVNVSAGDTVTAGEVLATIDSAELASGVTSAESDVAEAEAKLADDQDADASDEQLAADIAQISTANDALAQATEALAGASLVATFDGTVATVDLAVGEELASGGAGGTRLTGSATGSGQSSSTLTSSTSSAQVGATGTTTSSAQIQVVSAGRYEVDLTVGATDVESVSVGQSADLTLTTSSSSSNVQGGFGGFGGGAPPDMTGLADPTGTTDSDDSTDEATRAAAASGDATTAEGTVTEVSQVADASSGVASYTVTVEFTAPSTEFYVGSTVSAEIETAQRTDVVQVSSRAIATSSDGSTVTVATDGTVDGATETRAVETGLTSNGMTEITSGVEAGEQVLVTMGGGPGGGFPTQAPATGAGTAPTTGGAS